MDVGKKLAPSIPTSGQSGIPLEPTASGKSLPPSFVIEELPTEELAFIDNLESCAIGTGNCYPTDTSLPNSEGAPSTDTILVVSDDSPSSVTISQPLLNQFSVCNPELSSSTVPTTVCNPELPSTSVPSSVVPLESLSIGHCSSDLSIPLSPILPSYRDMLLAHLPVYTDQASSRA